MKQTTISMASESINPTITGFFYWVLEYRIYTFEARIGNITTRANRQNEITALALHFPQFFRFPAKCPAIIGSLGI